MPEETKTSDETQALVNTRETQKPDEAQSDDAGQSQKAQQAKALVNTFALGAGATALVPIPLVHGALVAGMQLTLLRRLASLYEVKFTDDLGKSLITALVAGGSTGALRTLTKGITGILGFVAILGVGAVSSSATYAVGNVFIQHFESGGTLLTFDPEKVREHYEELYDKAPKELKSKYAGVKP